MYSYLPTSAVQIPGRTPRFPWTLAHFPGHPKIFLARYIIYMKYTNNIVCPLTANLCQWNRSQKCKISCTVMENLIKLLISPGIPFWNRKYSTNSHRKWWYYYYSSNLGNVKILSSREKIPGQMESIPGRLDRV